MLKLTKRNYYSQEANRAYWSASQVKAMLQCPAAAMASLTEEEEPPSTALLVGNYVDAYFEGTLEQFTADHPEMFKRDGTLKADFLKAQEMIERAQADPVFMSYMRGQKQKIVTGNIGGLPFRGKLDIYKKGKYITDVKTVKDFEPKYKPGEGWTDFASFWEWPLQLAIYQTLEGNKLPCYLAVISKQDPPDLELIEVPQKRLDYEMERLIDMLPLLDAYKTGAVEPPRCGRCAYCRSTKQLTGPVPLSDFDR